MGTIFPFLPGIDTDNIIDLSGMLRWVGLLRLFNTLVQKIEVKKECVHLNVKKVLSFSYWTK